MTYLGLEIIVTHTTYSHADKQARDAATGLATLYKAQKVRRINKPKKLKTRGKKKGKKKRIQ